MASVVDGTRDHRKRPRVPLARGLRTLLLMLWVRLGSFNAIEEERPGGRWCRWLRGPIPSADTLGRIAAAADPDDLRRALVDEGFFERAADGSGYFASRLHEGRFVFDEAAGAVDPDEVIGKARREAHTRRRRFKDST